MSASSTTLVPSGATVPPRPAAASRWRVALPAVLVTVLLVLCSLALLGARAAAPGDGTVLGVAAADWSDGAVTVATGTAGLPTGTRITDG